VEPVSKLPSKSYGIDQPFLGGLLEMVPAMLGPGAAFPWGKTGKTGED